MGGEPNFFRSITSSNCSFTSSSTPLPDKFFVNKSPSKEAPKVPKSIDRKPPFCSLTSFFTVSVIQFNNIPLSSNDFTIFKRSYISSLEIINVV